MDFSQQVGIDLHIHSTASDGTLSPGEILALSQRLHLGAIAITDHDTIDGSKEALRIGIPPSVKFLTGIEVSASPPASFHCSGSFHILGYSIRTDDSDLNQTLHVLQEARKSRNPRIISLLNQLGFDLSLHDILNEVGQEGLLGRPHIARCMVKKGFVRSIDEAFDKFLGKGKPAYVDKYRIDSSRAIELILNAGGIPVLAHPFLLRADSEEFLESLIVTLKSMGLKGIEVYYPDHSPAHIDQYREMAKRNGLLMTGGTDFHGSLKPDIQMGSGTGQFFVPYEIYETLIQSC